MKVLAVDDESLVLKSLVKAISEAEPDAEIFPFESPQELLQFAEENFCDVAFLDIRIGETDGMEIAKKLKDILPDINIIFVTGYMNYAMDALALHASGYILKPIRKGDVERELNNLRYPVAEKKNRIYIKTFGNFEIFVDNEAVAFQRNRTKEILAYLVDREGALVSGMEIAAAVFGDRAYDSSLQKQMQVYFSDMRRALKNVNADQILSKKKNYRGVNLGSFQCDYYDFLQGKVSAINAYHGEYMARYSWGEMTTSWLNRSFYNNKY